MTSPYRTLLIAALCIFVISGHELATAGATASDTTPSPDYDCDGTVGFGDLLFFAGAFGSSRGDSQFEARFDLNGDGSVGFADLLIFADAFGSQVPPSGGCGDSRVIPSSPDNARYQWDASISQYRISWDPVPDATSYRVYYDTAAQVDVSCPGSCREIATVRDTSIAHFKDREGGPTVFGIRKIGYWVRACNDAGCSSYVRASGSGGDSSVPPPPDNVKFQWDPSISQYRISWDPVPDATSYRVYYDRATFFSVSCPGGCSRIATVSDTTISHNGSGNRIGYWVRACNDAGCSNYTTASRGDDIGSDLIVKSASVSNSSPNAGQSFTLSVTVRNQGNRQSPATMLRYYRSSDQGISKGDTEVGADAVNSLSTSGATSESISLTASSSYYYGACVDAVNNENNVKNNCSSSIPVIVGGQPLPPPPPPPPIIELDASNRSPRGITYANGRFYVVDRSDAKVYAYLSFGQRDPASDFDLSPDNRSSEGITYANDRFYVVANDKVYVYLSSGQRDATSDFDLSSDQNWPRGIAYANDRFYVVDDFRDKVYAYLSSGQRDTASDFDLSSDQGRPRGITYANDRFYVVDDFRDKVYAYLSSGQRDAASDFDLSSDNDRPAGITFGNDRFYVVDDPLAAVGRVYVVDP